MQKINITKLSSLIQAYKNCIKSNNKEWEQKHLESIEKICENLPHGSGIDWGVKLIMDESEPQKIVFTFEYHHLNEGGFYDGWTKHKMVLKPVFGGINIHIGGRDRNQIKDYLHDIFNELFTI